MTHPSRLNLRKSVIQLQRNIEKCWQKEREREKTTVKSYYIVDRSTVFRVFAVSFNEVQNNNNRSTVRHTTSEAKRTKKKKKKKTARKHRTLITRTSRSDRRTISIFGGYAANFGKRNLCCTEAIRSIDDPREANKKQQERDKLLSGWRCENLPQ